MTTTKMMMGAEQNRQWVPSSLRALYCLAPCRIWCVNIKRFRVFSRCRKSMCLRHPVHSCVSAHLCLAMLMDDGIAYHHCPVPLPPIILKRPTNFMTLFHEKVSNVATANIVLPLLTCVAARTGQHPWLVLVPATCGCSLAFLFPIGNPSSLPLFTVLFLSLPSLIFLCWLLPLFFIGTPPNAIAYATGQLTMRDMATTGALLIVAVALLLAFACATIMPMVAQLSSEDTEWTQAACEQD